MSIFDHLTSGQGIDLSHAPPPPLDPADSHRLPVLRSYEDSLIRRNYRHMRQRMRSHRKEKVEEMSSDSDAEEGGKGKTKMELTPANSTPKEELVTVDPTEVGMTADFKHLYSGKEDKLGRYQWQSKVPEDIGVPAEDAESERMAIIVRKVKAYNDPKKVLILHSIVIQSPLLKELLKDVLAGYPGVTVGLKRLEFSGRFEPLIHRWTQLNAAILQLKFADGPDAAEKLKHAQLLLDLLSSEFKETIDASSDMKQQGVMTYEHLWTLYQPGGLVYSRSQNQDRVFRLQSSKYGQDVYGNPVFWLTGQYVDYDGGRFGTQKLNLCIPKYEGTKPITKLQTLPLASHPNMSELKTRLIERGGKVEALAGSHYRAYDGIAWRYDHQGQQENHHVKGRIVIDARGWNKFEPNFPVRVHALKSKGDRHSLQSDSLSPEDNGVDDADEDDLALGDGGLPIEGYFANNEREEKVEKTSLTEVQKLICTPFVRGYSLKSKYWLNFIVNEIRDVSFNDDAFDSLVLPKSKKEMILGFTSIPEGYRSQFDDVIEGKGRGIIILLCGPPGVGKTLTAEAIAEKMNVPLFVLSAGDLGSDPRHVETKLQNVLDLCTRWNAILLLDEADVFLEERSLHELERNKLVTIFLRVLEYYEGIMFLTTNRVATFDQAFQSRIHVSLQYPELDSKSRKVVWRNFLDQHNASQASLRESPPKPSSSAAKTAQAKATASTEAEEEAKSAHLKRTQPHAITEKEIGQLASLEVNGRQIKNMLKIAQLLASGRGEALTHDHIEQVVDSTQHLYSNAVADNKTKSSLFS